MRVNQDLSSVRRWVISCIALLSISIASWGQADGDYQTRATGNWNANTTWQVYSGGWLDCLAGDYPGVAAGAGTVTIIGGRTVTVTADIPNNIGALTFAGAGVSNIVTFSGAYLLHVTTAITINFPTAGTTDNGIFVNSGIVTCASLTSANSAADARDCKVAISAGGILTVNGILSMGNNALRNDITFSGAGILNVTGNLITGQLTCVANSTINVGGALTPTAFTVSQSNVNYYGNAQNIANFAYYNLSTSNSGIKTLPNANVTVSNNLNISSSTLAFTNVLARTLTVTGDLSGDGTIDMSPGSQIHTLLLGGANNAIGTLTTAAVASVVNYNRAGAQTIFGSPGYRNLTVSNGFDKSLQGNVSVGGTLSLTNGKILLGINDLTLTGAAAVAGAGAANFVVADGTGQLKKVFAAGATGAYNLPVGDITGTIDYSPVSITFTANSVQRTIGVRVTDAVHPNDGGSLANISRYWSFTNDQAGTYAYNASFNYSINAPTDLTGAYGSLRVNRWDGSLSNWTQYTTTGAAPTITVSGVSEATGSLDGSDFTGRDNGATTYFWNQTGTVGSWITASNWTPERLSPQPNDILIFDNNGTTTATNVPAQSIERLIVSGSSDVTLESAAAATLIVNNGTGTDLDINSGSSLSIGPNLSLTLAAASTAMLDGALSVGTGTTFTTSGAATVTTVTGSLSNSGTITGTLTGLVFEAGSNYNHNRDNGTIPTATWNTTSNCNIAGLVSAAPAGLGQIFGNVNYSSAYTLTLGAGFTVTNNLDISAGTIAGAGQTINLTGDLTGTGGLSFTTGRLNIGGNNLNTGLFTYGTTSTVNYYGTAQQVKGTSYGNLIIAGGDVKTLLEAVTINGTLTLTSGVLRLGDYDLTLANTTAVAGAPFGITNMIETNAGGRFIRSANAVNQNFNQTYPVGSGGYYNPLIITLLPNSIAAPRSISVGAVPINLNIVSNGINKYWDLIVAGIITQPTTVLSFQYNPGEVVGDPLLFQPYTNGSGSWAVATGPSFPGSNPATSTGSATITGFWTVGSPSAFYSYQTGFWDQATTWTFDPGGTTGPGTTVPGQNDKVVILSGRTVSLQEDNFTQNLDITINNGGILDQTTFNFASSLGALRGDGTLKLTSSSFPVATINSFVTTDGGITEYNINGAMSSTQATYYHLIVRSAGTVTQVSDVTLNGNLDIKQGIFQINDATPRRLKLIINGNVTVDNSASIVTGTGGTRSNPGPLPSITGNTGAFLNYYELNSHRIQVYGDFTNNGVVRFSNLTNPVYNSFPANGFATVYFQGLSDKTVNCNGQTDFYNLVVDKGTDQTFKLTVSSSAYSNFRLFGANTSDGSVTLPVSPAGNPNLKKALWIKNGTLVLQGLVAIPSLTEGATAGAYPSDFFIPANGALQLDGAGVIVLSTADDFTEVNAAYGIAGGSNAAYGINTVGGYSGLSVLGKLQINDGYLSTRESSGLLYWSYAPGQIILNGGKLDIKQFHNPEGGATGLISYSQNGGNVIVRGRFTNTINYTNPADLSNPVINTSRVVNAVDAAAGTGSFSISSNAANAYSVSGGVLSIYDVCNTTATPHAFLINCPVSNINVTGGIVNVIPTTGTLLADANYLINSTAPFNNLIINRVSGASSVQLNTNPLVVLNDLTLNSGVLIANNLNATIGGNFLIEAGTTYTPGTNTTIFNGTGNQAFTVNLAAPLSLNKLTIDKTAGIALNFAGTQPVINVTSDFRLVLGTMNDNGNSINIAGNVFNSGIHAGAGKVSLNGTLTQTIDGNGIFGNLELNNTNAAPAPVSLLANITLNGLLTFSQDKLFNINTFNLRLNSTASIVNGGVLRYIKSSGNAGDAGLTKVYTNPATFDFPIGVVNYTPGSIGFSAAPTSYGSITVIPVNFEHSNVTTPGRSLNYFWRVKSTGFVLGSASVTHGYIYNQTNVVTGAGITEDEYVAARFDILTSSWTKGTSADVDETNNIIGEPGAGSFLENVTFIEGDYTAGDDNPVSPFGTPEIYYSRINGAGAGSGLWSNINTWSTDGVLQHAGAPAVAVPGAGDIVIIGARDSVYLATNNTIPNTDVRSCASLQIETGSALDIGYNFNSSFGMVLDHPNGNGNFRLTTSWNSGSTFTFPLGDFTDFNVNLGTTELYSTNPAAGTTYWLPNGILSYGNLILSPLGGSNIIFANNSLTIYGNLITRGQNADSWFCPTWNVNYPTPPNPVIAKTITINGDMDIQGGALIWYGNGALAQNFVVNGNVKVATLSALYVWSGATNQSMSIGGNLINNTDGLAHGLSTTSKVDFTLIPVTFFGAGSASISNTAGNPSTIFSTVFVNKGTSQATTLTIDIAGTLSTPVNNWLTLQNGTLSYRRTNPNSDFAISTTTPFTIPATSGLLVDLPSNTGNRNILIGNANNNAGDLLLSGKLTLINGNVYVGRTPGTDANNNDIEYSSGGASAIDIQGGNLIVNGQIRRNPLNAGGILKYTQSGGTVRVNGQASNATNAKFEVVNDGSEFTMSNGTVTIIRGNGAIITPSSPFGDLYLRPQTGSVTGGTIIFSQGGLAAPQNYFVDATIPLYNLSVTGSSVANYARVRILTSPMILNGDMTINANSVLDANNINTTFNGNFINTPGVGGYVYGTNLTTFSATNGSSYAGAQTITGATNFNNLVVNPGTSLTISNPSTVFGNLTISTGTFILGGNVVNLKGNLTNTASYTDNNTVGSGIMLNGTSLQLINGTGAYNRLILNNPAGAAVENDITIQEDLTMTLGILDIKQNLISLGVNSLIQGAPFGATKMITSDGVFSNVGLRKFFNPGATSFLYPIGTSGKYTPALLTVTASNTVGFVRVNNINDRHPAILDPSNALDYYWEIQSSGITGFSGSLVLNYLQGDVVGDEPNYLAARLLVPGTSWSKTLGVDPAANTITFNYITSNNLSGEYTAGTTASFPGNVPIYTSNADGNWTNQAIWTQTGGDPYPVPPGGPNGFIVIINHEVTLDANFSTAYRTTINDELRVTSLFFGHNLGTVDGSGTLYLESGSFPAGVFTTFLDCSNNATIEYGGTGTYTIIADLYDNIPNIVFSGTGTRVLPNKDLTVCNQLIIDGPTLDNSIYNKKLFIQGSMSRLAGLFKSGTGAGATVSFTGTGLQTIGAALGDFTGANSFNNFEINNNAGLRVNDGGAIEISGNLLLTNGLINTASDRKVTITNPSINCVIPAGGSINSFVDGPLIKRISQYDNFLFPIGIYIAGPGNILGNNIKLSSTQTGPLLWSAEYKSPNGTSGSITAPLLGVSAQEYYTVSTTVGSQTILNINWVPTSDVTPLITGGLSNIRLANYNTGLSSWVEIPSTATGNNFNGTATSVGVVTSTGSDNYTLASITDLKPRAKLSPVGPVCGNAGIPISFTAPFVIPFDYVLSYTIDGIAQVPVTISSLPYTLPTAVTGAYKLTDFTYDSGNSIGVVDASIITVNPVPTISDAGLDQTHCGITTAILAGNTPIVGTGLWSIISGAGGTLIAPSNPSSQFIGLNGVSYTLRWTISSGTCLSSDDVNINFTILPDAPAAAANQSFCEGAPTIADLVAIPPPGCTVDWYSAASGGVLLPGGTALVSGTTYYAESNGGGSCTSLTRTAVTVTINSVPVPGLVGPNLVCVGSTGNVYSTEAGKTNYVWSVVGGFISAGGLGTDNTATVTWTTQGPQTISINYEDVGGCTAASPTLYNVTVLLDNTVNLTSAVGTDAQTVCIGTAIANITYATTGATGATVTGLPAGVTGLWAANVVTISGTPTAAGPFTYTVTLTGGCGVITTTGSITVTPDNTVNLTSAVGTDAQTVCISTAIANITYATTGATGATVTGLPAGVTGLWAANVVTISGTPTAAGPFTYTVTLTGGCGVITTTGSITVTPDNTVNLTSAVGTDAQTVCIGTAIANITYATTGATGATVTGLPAGVTGLWAANVVTISGTPTAAGPFTYTVTLTGGCGVITTTGSITVTPDNTVNLTSAVGTDAQTVCISTAIANITYATTGATGATVTGLPAGVTGLWAANVVTISGTPTAAGPFTYTVTLTGGCGVITTTGSITVTPNNTVNLTSAVGTDAQTVCIGTAIANITYATTGATGATVTGLPAGVTGLWAANVVTISGTPTAAGPFTYTVTLTGGCGVITTTGSITVTPDNTVNLTSAVGTDAQTVCISTAIANITYATTGATGATVTGLPAGVTGLWAANVVTISGTPTAAGPFTYTVTLTGGCGVITTTGSITVTPDNTVNLTSAVGTDAQTVCIGTAIANITYATTGATGATVTGLPAGVTGLWAANVVTISGTPTAAGPFTYTVTLTGGCGVITTTGSITVTPDNTVNLTSAVGTDAQTVCISTAIANITYATTGATGATVTGLPAGVTGLWAANVVTISGTPTAAGPFTYTVTLTGGCGVITTTGSITVTPNNTVNLTSAVGTDAQTVCIGTAIANITYATTGATGATVTGLPAGVTGLWAANVVTISGTPTAAGPFTYTVTLTGGCGVITTTGSITVTPNNTVNLTSAVGTDAQTVCIGTAIANITYATTGATGATVTGLPAGVTGLWAANVVTISGTPTAAGPFTYTVTLTGGCGVITTTGSITVTPNNTVNLTSAVGTDAQTVCIGTAIANITYATTGATGATVTGLPAGVTGLWAANVVTISGTPTAAGPFTYTVTLTGGCGVITTTGSITVTPNNTVNLTSAVGTDAQTVCIGTAIANITYATTGATGATVTGLPAGVTGLWAANVVTISGTPTAAGPFTYTVTLTGGCGVITTTGSITVTPDNTVNLTSAVGTDAQTVCISTAIANITYATTGATGATVTGLPAGVTGLWAANVVTISGTPTAAGPFTYTVTLTGGCGVITTTGSITVTPDNTVNLTSAVGTDAQTVCIGTAIANITYATTGATGATVTGLPAGVTGLWAANVVTISGTPTAAGPFTYTVTLTGGCGVITTTGSITVTPDNTVNLTSAVGTDAQTVCIGTAIANITYATTGATGATVTGLPAGVTGLWAANVVTISGAPTAAGPFTYTVTLTGGCGVITTTGSITVTPNNTVSLTSAVGTDAQTVCISTAIANITYATTGATGATVTGLPAGVTGLWAANVVTISGTPTAAGPFTYTVTLTGGCGVITTTGSITVTPNNTVSLTSAVGTDAQTVCIGTAIANITYATTGATGATVTGLPAGVTGLWAANVVTISGTPTAAGPFTYTVTLTGGCGVITTTGSITVTPDNTVNLTSAVGTDAQTVCIGTAIANITYATTGATGATVTGLPAGVTGLWAANVVTISGAPTAAGPFTYTVTLTGGCGVITTTGSITVTPNNTVNLTSAVGTDAQTVCIGTAIANITYATTGATGATVTGLPAGVTGLWAANVVTISGTPTAAGPFTYTVTLTGGCGVITTTGSITVTPNNTVTLTSPIGTDAQTVCIGTALINITYATTGATGATVTGLPAGVTGLWAANVVTISGTPTAAGPFTYTVTLTGGCGVITTTGSITVTPNNTVSLTSAVGTDAQTVCIGTAIANITYATTGATGATVTGLPAGVTGLWAANVVTISGAPTAAGPFTYTVTLTGGCGVITTTGSITVTPNNTVNLTSAVGTDAQTVCIGTAIANITYATTGATGATVTGLPAGVTGLWAANVVTISGTPTAAGPFTYTVTLTGGCGVITTTGSITVTPNNTVNLTSAVGTDAQTVCIGTAIANITYATTGATGATVTGLPAGVTGLWAANVVTISGTPTAAGPFTYTVTLTGGCGVITTTGSITVTPNNTVSLTSAVGTDAQTVCIGTAIANITYATTGATGATVTGLPAGVTGLWAANVVTISGTPTAAGPFTYTVTLTGGCGVITTTGSITVTPNNTVNLTSAVGTDAQTVCIGTAIANITYATTGATGATVTGLPAGVTGLWAANVVTISGTPTAAGPFTYTVTLTGGCGVITTTGSITVNNGLPVSVSITADSNPVCAGTTVVFTATPVNEGVTPIYQWYNGAAAVGINSPTLSYAPANGDIITVILTSSEVCKTGSPATSNAITMTVNAIPTVTFIQSDVLCYGDATGSIDITVAGGTPPLTYSWTGTGVTAGSEDQNGLAAGAYSVIVSDANSCSSVSVPVNINQPASALTGSITSQTNVTVNGGNDGSVTVAGSGGTSPYQYKIGSGVYQASGTFGTLTAGTYTVTIQDINLCTFDVPVTITEPIATLLGSITSQTDVACFGTATGSVTVTGSGGVTPYEYSLNAGAYQSSGTFGSLAAGNYTVTIRDASLSTFDVPVTITEPLSSVGGSITSQTNILCFGSNSGSVTVAGSGGVSPYQYKLDAGSYQASGTFGSLTAGSYIITVQDANLCTFDIPVTVTQTLTALTGSVTSQTNVLCFGSTNGSLTAEGSGGTAPYMYSLNGGTFQVSGTFGNLAGAAYTITIQDANLCTANISATIIEPSELSISSTITDASCPDVADGSITLTITGGAQPFSVIWSDGILTHDRQDIPDGTYSVVVSDANGCAASLDVVVSFSGSAECIEIPDIITPNNDGYNDTWQIKNIDMFPNAEVFVFTRWGKLVFNTKNIAANPWDGTFKGKPLPTDSYHYVLHLNDGSKPRSGVISIIR